MYSLPSYRSDRYFDEPIRQKTRYHLFIKSEDHISKHGVFFLKDKTLEIELIFGGTFSFKEDLILYNIILYVPPVLINCKI